MEVKVKLEAELDLEVEINVFGCLGGTSLEGRGLDLMQKWLADVGIKNYQKFLLPTNKSSEKE